MEKTIDIEVRNSKYSVKIIEERKTARKNTSINGLDLEYVIRAQAFGNAIECSDRTTITADMSVESIERSIRILEDSVIKCVENIVKDMVNEKYLIDIVEQHGYEIMID